MTMALAFLTTRVLAQHDGGNATSHEEEAEEAEPAYAVLFPWFTQVSELNRM